jgi:hypothetical protein
MRGFSDRGKLKWKLRKHNGRKGFEFQFVVVFLSTNFVLEFFGFFGSSSSFKMSEKSENPYDMNSPSFDADKYLQKLLKVSENHKNV